MTDITIPPEAVEAAARAHLAASAPHLTFDELPDWQKAIEIDAAQAACLAMLKAWPGVTYAKWRDYGQADRLVLPLPTENTND